MKNLIRVLAFGLLATAAVGCSRGGVKKVTVEGTVTHKGAPVPSGILRVVGESGEFATAPIRANGTFTLTDVTPGEVRVGIMEAPQSAGSSSDGKAGVAAKPVPLPAKYKDPQNSGLQYTIAAGQPLVIELK